MNLSARRLLRVGPGQPVAQKVLLGEDAEPGRHEPVVERQHGERHADGTGQLAGVPEPGEGLLAVILEHLPETLERALARGRHERPCASRRAAIGGGPRWRRRD